MKILFCLITLLLLSACGTDTGNPGREPQNQGTGTIVDLPDDQIIPTFVSQVCQKVESCHPTATQCSTELLTYNNIDEEIGLTKNSIENLQEVHDLLSLGHLIADRSQLALCLSEIDTLSCTSDKVKSAYNESIEKPFLGVAEMLPQECIGIVIKD